MSSSATPFLLPSPKDLYQNPTNPHHFSVKPFTAGQVSVATVLPPAQRFAADTVRRMFGTKSPDGSIHLNEEVLEACIAFAYDAGCAAALEAEYAAYAAENDPEMGTR